jgi:hypothetical protein
MARQSRPANTAESVIAQAMALRMGTDIAGDLAHDALWSLKLAGLQVCESSADALRSASHLMSASLGQRFSLPPDQAREAATQVISDLSRAGFEIVRRSNPR